MTEPKHTRGELTFNYAEMGGYDCMTAAVYLKVGNHHLATVDMNDYGQIRCIDPDNEMKDKAISDAARLVSGWNLLNRLDEMGVQDALKEIQELRDYIRKLELEKLSHF